MALIGLDGKPYQTSGKLQAYNPDDPQHALFNLWDEDSIRMGGSPIYYYEMHLSPGEIDTDYWEGRSKLYSPKPIELWAVYEPLPSQNYMSAFGMDSLNTLSFELNAKAVLRDLGHLPKIGSRIYTPHRGENWEIIQRGFGEFRMWGVLRLTLFVGQFQESVTTSGGKVTQNRPPIKPAI